MELSDIISENGIVSMIYNIKKEIEENEPMSSEQIFKHISLNYIYENYITNNYYCEIVNRNEYVNNHIMFLLYLYFFLYELELSIIQEVFLYRYLQFYTRPFLR